MKKLLLLVVLIVGGGAGGLAGELIRDDCLSDERLIDMAAGPEVAPLTINITEPSTKDSTSLVVVAAKGTFLHTLLPTADYEVTLANSKRGVIFTHQHARSKVVLVRTRYTDEQYATWSVMIVPKDTLQTGRRSVYYYTLDDYDDKRFKQFLASVVP